MSIRNFAMGLSIALLAAAAAAQERPPYGPDVSLDQAKKIAAGAAE